MSYVTSIPKGKLDTVIVHEHLVRDHNATGAIVLSNIYFLAIKHGQCFQSPRTIAIRTGISYNTVRRYINRFLSDGLLCAVYHPDTGFRRYGVGENADPMVVRAYKELLSKRPKSSESGKLITLPLKKITACRGKKAEFNRFIAYLTAYCVDQFANRLAREDELYGFFSIKSVTHFAKRFGVSRQTLAKALRFLRKMSKVRVERFNGFKIIDFFNTLKTEVDNKAKTIANAIFA